MVKHIKDALIEFKRDINRKKILENEKKLKKLLKKS